MLQIFRKNSKKEIGFKPTLIVFTAPFARYLFDGRLFFYLIVNQFQMMYLIVERD